MHFIRSSVSIVSHLSESRTPAIYSMMIYSAPTGFRGSSLQSKTLGIGIEVLDDTETQPQHQFEGLEPRTIPQKLIVATSELVVNLGGLATRVGSLATILESLSMVNMKD